MTRVALSRLTRFCDRLLRIAQIQDYPGAVNGLQVENCGEVTRVAAAVDATLTTVKLAAAAGAELLVVHHGLFWGQTHPWTGRRYELLRLLLDHNLAVYSAHLPLDMHRPLGNNARLCSALRLRKLRPFFREKGQSLGLQTTTRIPRDQLVQRLHKATGQPPRLVPGGPGVCRRIGVVSGGAGGQLRTAAAEGVDTFITGEGPHWTYGQAEELGLNVLYGGHYATETFGVKALAEELHRRFHLPWQFIDHPTGL